LNNIRIVVDKSVLLDNFILNMSQEIALQVSTGVLFALYVLIWGAGFIRSGIKWDNIYTFSEGLLDAILLRLFLFFGIGSLTIYILEPRLMQWSEFTCPLYIRIIGIPLGAISLVLLFLEIKTLGENFSPTLKISISHRLITTGIYRWVRHPMYMTLILIWVAFVLLSANWFIAIWGFLAYALIIVWRLPKEEKMLIDYFGDDYLEYMERTGKLFPQINFLVQQKK